MYAYKDLLELAGLTTRLYTLISTLHNLPKTPEGEVSADGSFEIRNVDVVIPGGGGSGELCFHLHNLQPHFRFGVSSLPYRIIHIGIYG